MPVRSDRPRLGHNGSNLSERLGPIEYRRPADLIPYANRLRVPKKERIEAIKASFRNFGFVSPVLINSSDGIIAGEARVMAAVELNLETIPVLKLGHLSPVEQQMLRIADNKIPQSGKWDEHNLAVEIASIIEFSGIDIEIPGFDTAEIDVILTHAGGMNKPRQNRRSLRSRTMRWSRPAQETYGYWTTTGFIAGRVWRAILGTNCSTPKRPKGRGARRN